LSFSAGGNKAQFVDVPLDALSLRKGASLPSEEDLSRKLLRELAGEAADPILVRKIGHGFEIVAGDTGYALAKRRGQDRVTVVLADMDDEKALLTRLSEGARRGDLNPVEEAEMLRELTSEYGLTQQQVAIRCGWKQSTVANKIRLLKLSSEVLEALRNGQIGERHARALLRVQDRERQLELFQRCVKMKLTAEEVERICQATGSESKRDRRRGQKKVFKDMRIFQNALRKVVFEMRKAGLEASCREESLDECWEFRVTVRIGDHV